MKLLLQSQLFVLRLINVILFHEKGSRCVICGFHSNPGEENNVWFCIFSLGGTSSDGSTSPRRRTSSLCFHSTFPTNGTKSSLNYKYSVIIINTCTHCFVCIYFSSKVWLLILIAGVFVVVSMCLFSKAYLKLFLNRIVNDGNSNNQSATLEWAGRYSLYIVNILTNQGANILISMITCMNYFNLVLLFNNRRSSFNCSTLLSGSRWYVAVGRHGLGQQLFRHRHFISDSPENETTHQHVRWFNRQWRYWACFARGYRHRAADTGKIYSLFFIFNVILYQLTIIGCQNGAIESSWWPNA